MSEYIECGLGVSKVVRTITDTGDQTIAVTLKGQKTIVHGDGEFTPDEDIVEITTTLKFSRRATAEVLGVAHPGNMKVFVLRDRDESLTSYDVKLQPEMQQKIV